MNRNRTWVPGTVLKKFPNSSRIQIQFSPPYGSADSGNAIDVCTAPTTHETEIRLPESDYNNPVLAPNGGKITKIVNATYGRNDTVDVTSKVQGLIDVNGAIQFGGKKLNKLFG